MVVVFAGGEMGHAQKRVNCRQLVHADGTSMECETLSQVTLCAV